MIGSWPLLALVSMAGGAAAPVPVLPAAVGSLVLLGLSAFFSGSETALFSLQPVDRAALRGDGGTTPVDRLLEAPRRTLATLLIGNEVVNLVLSTLTAGLLLALFPDLPWLNVVVLTPLLLLLGEVTPKVLALRLNRPWAAAVARPLLAFSWLVTPVRAVLTRLADFAVRLTGGTEASRKAAMREAQLRALIDQGRADGSLQAMEQDILHKVFEFGELTVGRLMTPRPDVFSLALTTPWEELLPAVREAGYSRVPVWRANPDDVVGILLVKRLLPLLRRAREEGLRPSAALLRRLLLPAHFVPTSKRAEDMLAEFRSERFHMAIVVDEHGSVVGVITLDDILGELVGELLDENDDEEPEVTEVREGTWTVRAHMDVSDFAERFGVALPEGDYTTVGGFVLARLGEVPDKGTEFTWNGLRFLVSGVEGHRITELCVAREEAGAAEPTGEAS